MRHKDSKWQRCPTATSGNCKSFKQMAEKKVEKDKGEGEEFENKPPVSLMSFS